MATSLIDYVVLDTLRLFNRGDAEVKQITDATEDFRKRTMEVLRMAFLSSGVLGILLPPYPLRSSRSILVFPILEN